MCFSASVSFGASLILAGTGIYTIKKTESSKILAFAGIPLLFGLQQFSEGILWLSIDNPELDFWRNSSIYLYIIIAQVIYPLWIPLAIWLMEPDKGRKKILSYFIFLGGFLSIYILYCTMAYDVSAVIDGKHVHYQLDFPNLALRRSLIFLTSVVPPFISSLRAMKLLGASLLISLIIAIVFFLYYIISLWCFFAAILSLIILLIVTKNKESHDQGKPDHYITHTRDFTQYIKDSEEKYWNKETRFDWQQHVRSNLKERLEGLDEKEFSNLAFKVVPILKETLDKKMLQIRNEHLPFEEDALKDIAECIPFDRTAINEVLVVQSPLKSLQLSTSKLKDQLEILESELIDLNEQSRLGLFKAGAKVKHIENDTEQEEQNLQILNLTYKINKVEGELRHSELYYKTESERLKSKIRTEISVIESQVLIDLEATSELLKTTLQSENLPKGPKDLLRLKDLILKRQLRGLKDICNHALVVEQSAIAPLTMGIIHYKRHREIQEAMTTFINDEAKHSATFRRYLVEKLGAKEYISAILIKGANRYMWLARFMPGVGMFLAVLVEAIGAAFLEFFSREECMPESLFRSICYTISEQDEKRHMDLCVEMYNELYKRGSKWERIRNSLALKIIMKSVYGDKTEDNPVIQAFRSFGVDADILYQHITERLSKQLIRVNMYVEPDKLLDFIIRK